jgi:pimeloyl-ACP methyl ester carboxylesterase
MPRARQDFETEAPLVADQLLGEPSNLVGFSYGAIVAMLAAAHQPDNVRSLTVIEPPATGVARGDSVVDARAAELDEVFSKTGDDLGALLKRFFDVARVPISVPDPLPEPLERGARALVGARSPTEAELPLSAILSARIPCFVVSGGHHAGYEAICDAIAKETNARRTVIRGAGHLIPETGDPFNGELEAFLTASV